MNSDWTSWDVKRPSWHTQDMPPDGDLTNSASKIIEIYTWVGEKFSVLIDDGPSHPKCKVEDVPPTTPPKVKKSRELMQVDDRKSGKEKGKGKGKGKEREDLVEDSLIEEGIEEVDVDILKGRRGKGKKGRNGDRDEVKKEKHRVRKLEREREREREGEKEGRSGKDCKC